MGGGLINVRPIITTKPQPSGNGTEGEQTIVHPAMHNFRRGGAAAPLGPPKKGSHNGKVILT